MKMYKWIIVITSLLLFTFNDANAQMFDFKKTTKAHTPPPSASTTTKVSPDEFARRVREKAAEQNAQLQSQITQEAGRPPAEIQNPVLQQPSALSSSEEPATISSTPLTTTSAPTVAPTNNTPKHNTPDTSSQIYTGFQGSKPAQDNKQKLNIRY